MRAGYPGGGEWNIGFSLCAKRACSRIQIPQKQRTDVRWAHRQNACVPSARTRARCPLAPTKDAVLRLRPGFFDQLPPGFDPIVRGIARQRELDAALGQEVGANPDFLIRRLTQGRRGGSFLR